MNSTTINAFAQNRDRWGDINDWDRDLRFSTYPGAQCGFKRYEDRRNRQNNRRHRLDRKIVIVEQCRDRRGIDRLQEMTCSYCALTYDHPEQRKACEQGVKDASRLARNKEGAAARRDGYFHGFTCGVDIGIDRTLNGANTKRGEKLIDELKKKYPDFKKKCPK